MKFGRQGVFLILFFITLNQIHEKAAFLWNFEFFLEKSFYTLTPTNYKFQT